MSTTLSMAGKQKNNSLKFPFFFLIFFAFYTVHVTAYKIIYLISPPRSMSVAFLRMMDARGDFTVLHEPTVRPYDNIHYPELTKDWWNTTAFNTFDEVEEHILQKSKNTNVFVKEMTFSSAEFLQRTGMLKQPNVHTIFLLRNPHHVVISFYNKCNAIPNEYSRLIGYKETYELFKYALVHGSHKPIILRTEDLYTQPKKTVRAICKALDIAFKPESLHWQDLGPGFSGEHEWREIKRTDLFQYWHGDAIKSTGFSKPRSYNVDEQGNPTFEEIANQEHRNACIDAYEKNLSWYTKLLNCKQYLLDP